MATATRPCMNTDMSRNGLAMVVPYPFLAGVAAFVGVLAGFGCDGAVGPVCGGVISADNWKLNVCTAAFLSSCLVSLISTFWKYPERFKAVMKLATALTEAEEPSIERLVPFRVMVVSQRFSVRETVLATMSSRSCPPLRSLCNCSIVDTRC